jgi:acyl dehydratase
LSASAADLRVGEVVIDVEHRPDERQLFLFSAATNNAHRIHYDLPYAQSEGYPGLLVQGPLQRALMARYLMQWAGPSARLRRLRLQHRSSAFVGDTIRFRAEIADVARPGGPAGSRYVELSLVALADADRKVMLGSASVLLPDVDDPTGSPTVASP